MVGWAPGSRRVLAAGVALSMAAACGSTVNRGTTVVSSAGAGGAQAVDGGSDQTTSAAGPDANGGTAGSSSAAASARAAGAQAVSKTTGRGKSGASVRGITDDTISIGFGTTDVTKLAATFAPGSNTANIPTIEESVNAIVGYMNRHGGIAGRKIVPYYHDFPLDDLVVPSREQAREQAMCDDFTLDRPTFAAIPLVSAAGVFNSCAAKRDLVSVDVANLGEPVDAQRFKEIGNVWYFPDWAKGEHREQLVVDQLVRRGFFKNAKLGVMIYDDPRTQRSYDNGLLPALKKIGVTPIQTFKWQAFDNGQAAVLQFRAAGVDHVMWGDCVCGGLEQSSFMNVADNQAYHPLYAISTDLNPGAMPGIGAPPDQMAASVAFGWSPGFDGVKLDGPLSSTQAQCREAAKEANQSGSNDTYCEGLFFIKRALEAGPQVTAAGLRVGAESLGAGYTPSSTFGSFFGPGRHDGVAAVRDMKFNTDCKCWEYFGPVIRTN
jgi:hypothetical protein